MCKVGSINEFSLSTHTMNFYLLGKEDKVLKGGNKNFSKHEFEYIRVSLSIQ